MAHRPSASSNFLQCPPQSSNVLQRPSPKYVEPCARARSHLGFLSHPPLSPRRSRAHLAIVSSTFYFSVLLLSNAGVGFVLEQYEYHPVCPRARYGSIGVRIHLGNDNTSQPEQPASQPAKRPTNKSVTQEPIDCPPS